MSVKFTEKQQLAIQARGADLLVSAGAGSGKTAVLVQRVLSLITDEQHPVDIDRLLIVTFTKAAASEMRLKIQTALFQLAQETQSPYLQRQLALLPGASISTIHSFCSDVIRSNFHLTDLDPTFKVADESETDLLKLEALDEVLEEAYDDPEHAQSFYALLDAYSGGKDDSALGKLLLDIYKFSQSMPYPDDWFEASENAYAIAESGQIFEKPFGAFLLGYLQTLLEELIHLYNAALEEIRAYDGLENYLESFQSERYAVSLALETLETKDFDQIAQQIRAISFGRLRPCKKGFGEEAEQVKSMRKKAKEEIETLQNTFFYMSGDDLVKELQQIRPHIHNIRSLEQKLAERFREKKQEKNCIDFHDLEHITISILAEKSENHQEIRPTSAALELREKFAYIFIDEYQDSNFVQELIFSSIKRDGNLFMVGDVKQSIYRFRNAMPDLFQEKYLTYPETMENHRLKVCLYQNFRSRNTVLDFVNFIFFQIMTPSAGETNYTEAEFLNAGATYEAGSENYQTEIHLIEKDGEEGASAAGEGQPVSGTQAQAALIARRIRQLVSEEHTQVFDKDTGNMRPATYRDVVILLRATKNKADVFYEVLSSFGIPVYTDLAAGFFEAAEIRVILSLLQVIDNPRVDIDLIALLRSPIFAFDETLLFEIRLGQKEGCFYDAVAAQAGSSAPCRNFLNQLRKWRTLAKDVPVDQLLLTLYDETGYEIYVSALRGGAIRKANLRTLYLKARQFESGGLKGLYYFITYIRRLQENKKDFSAGQTVSEHENVVRILSIHKSKGLEYPIVFLADCEKRFNRNDLRNPILLHHALGIAPDFVDTNRRVSYPSLLKETMRQKLYLEGLSEEMRVLYVALTRAREKLILVGCVPNAERTFEKWSKSRSFQKPPILDVWKSSSYFDFIGPCLPRHLSPQAFPYGIQSASLPSFTEPVSVFVHQKDDAFAQSVSAFEETAVQMDQLEQSLGAPVKQEPDLQQRLSFCYPFLAAGKTRAKYSVTELKHIPTRAEDEAAESPQLPRAQKSPAFLQGTAALSAAQKGTALHTLMQHIDPQRCGTLEEIQTQIDSLTVHEFLTREAAQSINPNKIKTFFESEVGEKMKHADQLLREQRFFFKLEAQDFPGTLPEGESVMVQGIIDCYFHQPDGIYLLDYKTDRLDSPQEFIGRYQTQLSYYAKALERFLQEPVAGKYIYSFYLDACIKL